MKKYFMAVLLVLIVTFMFQPVAKADSGISYEEEMQWAKDTKLQMDGRTISGKIKGDWNRGTFTQTIRLNIELSTSVNWERKIRLYILPNGSEDGEKLIEITLPPRRYVLINQEVTFTQSDLERISMAGQYKWGNPRFMTKVDIVVWIMVRDPGKYGSWTRCDRIPSKYWDNPPPGGYPCYISKTLLDVPVINQE